MSVTDMTPQAESTKEGVTHYLSPNPPQFLPTHFPERSPLPRHSSCRHHLSRAIYSPRTREPIYNSPPTRSPFCRRPPLAPPPPPTPPPHSPGPQRTCSIGLLPAPSLQRPECHALPLESYVRPLTSYPVWLSLRLPHSECDGLQGHRRADPQHQVLAAMSPTLKAHAHTVLHAQVPTCTMCERCQVVQDLHPSRECCSCFLTKGSPRVKRHIAANRWGLAVDGCPMVTT